MTEAFKDIEPTPAQERVLRQTSAERRRHGYLYSADRRYWEPYTELGNQHILYGGITSDSIKGSGGRLRKHFSMEDVSVRADLGRQLGFGRTEKEIPNVAIQMQTVIKFPLPYRIFPALNRYRK